MFDTGNVVVNGIQLMTVVFGLTEFIKDSFNLTGKKVTFLAASLGVALYVLYGLIGILPEPYGQVVTMIVTSVTFGLTASGYYKFAAARLPKTVE